jgi:hypothetical protein
MAAPRLLCAALGATLMAGAAAGLAEAPMPAVPPGADMPTGWQRMGTQPHLLRLRASETWMEALAAAEPARRVAVLEAGIAALEAHLARMPADALAWAVLAQFRALRLGLGEPVLAALRMSYRTGRHEMAVSMWRIATVLWLFPLLPPDLRAEAEREMAVMAIPFRSTNIVFRLADAAVAAGPDREEAVLRAAATISEVAEARMRMLLSDRRGAR